MTTPRLKRGLVREAERIEVLCVLEDVAASGKAYDRMLADKLLAERQWRDAYSEDAGASHTQPTMREGT